MSQMFEYKGALLTLKEIRAKQAEDQNEASEVETLETEVQEEVEVETEVEGSDEEAGTEETEETEKSGFFGRKK